MKLSSFLCMRMAAISLIALNASCRLGRDVTLVKRGKANVTIYAPADVMRPTAKGKTSTKEHPGRIRLRESIKDLAHYLERISGAKISIVPGAPPEKTKSMPILIGKLGIDRFGVPLKKSPFKQAFRVVVSKKAIACMGESDEATSYAIYEILDRLGCRWYMPSDMGEVIPSMQTIKLPEMDFSHVPATAYRNLWYADKAFRRRNRLGGIQVRGQHGLEGYISPEQRKAHPEWNAEINGKRVTSGRICWGNAEVSAAVADEIIRRLDKKYQPSMTLSPGDGTTFCQCKRCRALDAGDIDPSMDTVSLSDRLVHFSNRIVERVTKEHPDVLFGLYAYVQYTRPPIREKPHPNIVIAVAPITYCRAHALTNPKCRSRQAIRPIIEGWSKVAKNLAFRGFLYNLAEVNAPYPVMKFWSEELPFYLSNGVKFWMPESMPSFEGSLPGLYLNVRLPWYPKADPRAILDEFFSRFYGRASDPMRRYWQTFDDAWSKVPEHAGNVFGHAKRFTPEVMKTARGAIDDALAQCETAMEYRRVKFSDDSLSQFERFMKMRWDLADGRLANLDRDGNRWMEAWRYLRDQYGKQYAFGRYQGQYFKRFFMGIYGDGSRIAKEFRLPGRSIRSWRYQVERGQKGDQPGWSKPDFDDKAWKTTDPCVESWSSLGLFNYFGSVWYRTNVHVPQIPEGKKVYLWFACTDGSIKLFVNGKHILYRNEEGKQVEQFSGYSSPASFEISSAVRRGSKNQVTIVGSRHAGYINELGTGGLMGPVVLYVEK